MDAASQWVKGPPTALRPTRRAWKGPVEARRLRMRGIGGPKAFSPPPVLIRGRESPRQEEVSRRGARSGARNSERVRRRMSGDLVKRQFSCLCRDADRERSPEWGREGVRNCKMKILLRALNCYVFPAFLRSGVDPPTKTTRWVFVLRLNTVRFEVGGNLGEARACFGGGGGKRLDGGMGRAAPPSLRPPRHLRTRVPCGVSQRVPGGLFRPGCGASPSIVRCKLIRG